MADEFDQGDRVAWSTPQGRTTGTVVLKLTAETEVAGRTGTASEDDLRYVVESEKSGKEASHKPSALSRIKE